MRKYNVLILCGMLCGLGVVTAGAQTKARRRHHHESAAARARKRQPHWITPLATLTPLLEREYRFDLTASEFRPGLTVTNWGSGKGLELIPTSRTELIVTQPSYATGAGLPGAWGAAGALVKYEIAVSPKDQGNYVATGMVGVSVPVHDLHANDVIISPHFGWGKGEGRFDIQQDLALGLPAGGAYRVANWAINTAFQYHAGAKLWPEIEINASGLPHLPVGNHDQLDLTPGLVAGPWRVSRYFGLTVGAGVQIPTVHGLNETRNWIFSLRLPF